MFAVADFFTRVVIERAATALMSKSREEGQKSLPHTRESGLSWRPRVRGA
jgi:hypothetical protein